MTKAGIVQLELAGMITAQGRIGRRVETDGILRPDWARMSLDSRNRELRYDSRPPLLGDVQRPDVLDEFIRLDTATAQQILEFAKSFGALSVRAIREAGFYAEDLDGWRNLAGRASATLELAGRIHRGEKTDALHWELLRPWWFTGWAKVLKNKVQVERNQLADVLNAWLKLAEVRPCFSWTKASSAIIFTNLEGIDEGQLTMLGAIALQIVRAAGRARFIATCFGCGQTYLRQRQAPAGRANYCKKCGIKAAWRDAQARRRVGVAKGSRAIRTRKRGRL